MTLLDKHDCCFKTVKYPFYERRVFITVDVIGYTLRVALTLLNNNQLFFTFVEMMGLSGLPLSLYC